MLGLDGGQIITGRNDTTVQDYEVAVAGGEKNRLLRAATEGDAGEEDGGVVSDLRQRQELHETGAQSRSIVVIDFIKQARLDVKLYFALLKENYTSATR